MAATALIEGSSPADDARLATARRTLEAARVEARWQVTGHPDCSARWTAGDAALVELVFTGILAEIGRLRDRLDALEGQ